MKLFLFLSLILSACAHDQSCKTDSQIQVNNQTINQTNGACNIDFEQNAWQFDGTDYQVTGVNICGEFVGYEYQGIVYNPLDKDPLQPIGLQPVMDNYYTITNGNNECWFKVTNGTIDAGAPNPSN
jgi:hypothetical protein